MNDGESIPVRAEADAEEARTESDAPVSAPVPLAENPPARTAASPEEGNHEEDKHEESTMIEVHAPHGGIATWRDFWIHLGTIALGLLIALGLEQSVEWTHHLHQRHQLETDLRAEGLQNKDLVEKDFRFLDMYMQYELDMKAYVDAMRAHHSRFPLPDKLAQEEAAVNASKGRPSFTISTAAWATAQESEMVALLPRAEAETYSRLYREEELEHLEFVRYLEARDTLGNFSSRSLDRRTQTVDYARLSDDDLKEDSALISAFFNSLRSLKTMLKQFYGANNAVLSGAGSAEEVAQALFDARQTIKDDLGTDPEWTASKVSK